MHYYVCAVLSYRKWAGSVWSCEASFALQCPPNQGGHNAERAQKAKLPEAGRRMHVNVARGQPPIQWLSGVKIIDYGGGDESPWRARNPGQQKTHIAKSSWSSTMVSLFVSTNEQVSETRREMSDTRTVRQINCSTRHAGSFSSSLTVRRCRIVQDVVVTFSDIVVQRMQGSLVPTVIRSTEYTPSFNSNNNDNGDHV
jgi:hypothetical protein